VAFSWEPGSPALIGTILGSGSGGTIEIVPLPGELRGRLAPGTTSICFGVDGLQARIAACRSAGLPVRVGVGDLPYAVVTAAGLEFELVATGSCCGGA